MKCEDTRGMKPVQTISAPKSTNLEFSKILRMQVKAIRSLTITANITRLQAPRQCIKGLLPPTIKPKGTELRQKTDKKDDPNET